MFLYTLSSYFEKYIYLHKDTILYDWKLEKYQRSNFIIIEDVKVFHHHTIITKNCIIYFVVQIVPVFAIVSCFSWLLNRFDIALEVCILRTFLLSGPGSSCIFSTPLLKSAISFFVYLCCFLLFYFPYGFLQDIEYNYLCYTVGPWCLSILLI